MSSAELNILKRLTRLDMDDYKEENVLDTCLIITEQKVICDPICA